MHPTDVVAAIIIPMVIAATQLKYMGGNDGNVHNKSAQSAPGTI